MDLGTGSGCIALSLAQEFTNAKILAVDISIKALFYAKDGCVFVKGDFERASSISVNLNEYLSIMGEQSTYNIASTQILPKGLTMVMKDYPDAKKKLESKYATTLL